MKENINLYEILGEKGEGGLVNYLKSCDDNQLKILKNQNTRGRKKYKNREETIIGILTTMQNALNVGHVFSVTGNKTNLLHYYDM